MKTGGTKIKYSGYSKDVLYLKINKYKTLKIILKESINEIIKDN